MTNLLPKDASQPAVTRLQPRGICRRTSSRVASGFLGYLLCVGWFSTPTHAAGPWDLEQVSFQSSTLTRFWRAPVSLRAAVYVPAACRESATQCAVLYHFPGAGQSIEDAWDTVGAFVQLSESNPGLRMAHVVLDELFDNRNHYYVDSANNGPWRSALMREFIPYLERTYGIGGSVKLRYLHGYSTGGWVAVSLQTSYSAVFNGAWGIAPDPVDFRFFFRTNVTPGSRDNFYFDSAGVAKVVSRGDSTKVADYMQFVDNNPAAAGLFSLYEFAWSQRGRDGYPTRLFDRTTGVLQSRTLSQWAQYDIARRVKSGGRSLKNALAGKLNLYCGTNDTFFLNEPTAALCEYLASSGYQATCTLVEGRNHFNLYSPSPFYPQGLPQLILTRAAERAAASGSSPVTRGYR